MNFVGVLEYFDRFFLPGDYIVVEDTNEKTPKIAGEKLLDDLVYDEWGPGKLNNLKGFLKEHSDHYVIDQHYSDFFG